jgi:hypothetical protein
VSNSGRCSGCGQLTATRPVCVACENRTADDLRELTGPDGLFARLVWLGADGLARGGGGRPAGPVVKTSKINAPSPVRDQVINLLGAGGVVHTLQRHATAWHADLGFGKPVWRGPHHFVVVVAPGGIKVPRPGQLDLTVRMLLNNLPWAAENREDFSSFRREVHRFVGDTRKAIDPTIPEPTRVLVGRCPGSGDTACGTQLMADPFAMTISCAACGSRWRRDQWATLGDTLHAAPRL